MAEAELVLKEIQRICLAEGWVDPATPLTGATRLREDLGLDSFELVQLILALNRHFQLELGSHLLTGAHLYCLESLSALVAGQLRAGSE